MLILIKGFDEPCSILMKMLNSLKNLKLGGDHRK